MEYSFKVEIQKFIERTESLELHHNLVHAVTSYTHKEAAADLKNYIEEYGIEKEKGVYVFKDTHNKKASIKKKKYESLKTAASLVPRSYIVSIISQYDAYLGRLIKGMFYNQPNLLNSLNKELAFSEIIKFKDIDEITEYILEKEIETVLRKSHSEQFDWLENKLGIKLKNGLDIWKDFIELTERRNLFVHTDGVISDQYLKVCERNGIDISNLATGQIVNADRKYVSRAYDLIFELAIKLGQVLWRKIIPDQIEEADDEIVNIAVDLISKGKYKLSVNLIEFNLKLPNTKYNDLLHKINLAQSYKWLNNDEKCKQILSQINFSSLSYQYKLAEAVLKSEFDTAAEYMKRDTEINKGDWYDWPLFKEFRKTAFFTRAYYEKYNEEYKDPGKEIKIIDKEDISS